MKQSIATVRRMGKRLLVTDQLRKSRERRSWSVGEAASKTESVGRESLLRLENGQADPSRVTVRTAIELIDLYWPDLDLDHFFRLEGKIVYRAIKREMLR